MAPQPPAYGDGDEENHMPAIDERRPLVAQEEDDLHVRNYNTDGNGDSDDEGDDSDDEDDNRSTATEATILGSVMGAVTDTVENIVEGTEHLFDGVTDVVHEIADEILDTKDNLVDELHEADDGDLFFLDMVLTRNLSILPSDVVDVANHGSIARIDGHHDVPGSEGEEGGDAGSHTVDDPAGSQVEKPPAAPTGIPIVAYFLLATAVCSLSSIGPLLDLQHDATGSMKLHWRMMGTAVLLFPFAAVDIYHHGFPRLTSANWVIFLASTFFYDMMGLGFVLSLNYTAVGNAVILSNSQSLLLLIGKLFVGSPVVFMEGAGAIVAFSGAVLCSKDSAEGSPSGSSALLGDALAIISAIGGVGYLVFAKTSRNHMSLYVYTFLTMFIGALIVVPFQWIIMRETVTFDFNREHGMGGFLNLTADRLPLELVMVVICNMCGTIGYVRSMQYFDSVVIATAGLMEPVIAEFLAFALGVAFLPGWKGWLGNLLVAGGTVAVVYPASQSGNKSSGMH